MEFSEIVESIPKEQLKKLKTYLSDFRTSDRNSFTSAELSEETGLSNQTVRAGIADLVENDILEAFIEIRCPECDASQEKYLHKSEVPDLTILCEFCGREFNQQNEDSWIIRYRFGEEKDKLSDWNIRLEKVSNEGQNVDSAVLLELYEKLKDMKPDKRGMKNDYFTAILFQQIDEVSTTVKIERPAGEADTFIDLAGSPGKMQDIIGINSICESKWRKEKADQDDVSKLARNLESLGPRCNYGFFLSMSGFTQSKSEKKGVKSGWAEIKEQSDPAIIPILQDDVERIIEEGSPKEFIVENYGER